MTKQQLQVEDFFRSMNLEIGTEPGLRDSKMRVLLVEEESQELRMAINRGDFLAAIDAVCDLMYVTLGCAVAWGIDIEPFFDEVHRANMRKEGGPKHPETGKQLKPEGWVGPDHTATLQFMLSSAQCVEEQLIRFHGRRPEPRDIKTFWALQRVSRFMELVVLDEFAKAIREEWATYAKETLGDKAPTSFTKPWDETGDWGKEGNRRVAQRVLNLMVSKLVTFEAGEVHSTLELERALVTEANNG